MVSIVVDGKPVDQPLAGTETVADVVKAVSKGIPDEKSIVKVNLDGEDVTGRFDQQEAMAQSHSRLEVTTGDTRNLAGDTAKSLEDFHGSLMTALSKAAEEYRMGDVEKSNQIFAQCLDGLQIVLRTSYSVANLLKLKGDTVIEDGTHMDEAMQQISGMLDEILEAQNQGDNILIADLIEYELTPVMETWGKMLHQLVARSGKGAA